MRILDVFKSFSREEDGAIMAEYGILLVLIAIALIAAVGAFAGAILSAFSSAETTLETGCGTLTATGCSNG